MKKQKKRHLWKHPRANYGFPREDTPSVCTRCGAKHWYSKRPKKQPSAARVYGPNTEDFVYMAPTGWVITDPKPVPACVPR